MALRPESERILNRDQLAEFTRRLSMLSTPGVKGVLPDCVSRSHLRRAGGFRQPSPCSSWWRRNQVF